LITLIIFSSGFNVDFFGSVLDWSVRRKVRIVRQPLAEPATKQKFLRRYREVVTLAPNRRALFRKSIRPFGYRSVSVGDSHGTQPGYLVLRVAQGLGFESNILAAHAYTAL
jgi:hypothetical protein